MSKSNLIIAAAALAAASFASFGSASAQEYKLSVDSTQLQTSEGTASAYTDLRRQADSICREVNKGTRSLRTQVTCEKTVLDEAVKQIDNTRLSAMHDGAPLARYSEKQ